MKHLTLCAFVLCMFQFSLSNQAISISDHPSKDETVIISLNEDNSTKKESTVDISSNVFRLLQDCGLPVAFQEQIDSERFSAQKCQPIRYNIVIQREVQGVYATHHPYIPQGQPLSNLVIQFFLQAEGKWGGKKFLENNPLITHQSGVGYLYKNDQPILKQEPFATIQDYPLKDKEYHFFEMRQIAQQAFLILEKAWHQAGQKLVELTLQFGLDFHDNLHIVGIISHDSWQLKSYDNTKKTTPSFSFLKSAPELPSFTTNIFKLPKQKLIMWLANEKHNIDAFIEQTKKYLSNDISISTVRCSALNAPIQAYQLLMKYAQESADAVILVLDDEGAYTACNLATQTVTPVICVSEGTPDLPFESPVIIVNKNKSARMVALQIFAKQNPRLYAQLQLERMQHMKNIIQIN